MSPREGYWIDLSGPTTPSFSQALMQLWHWRSLAAICTATIQLPCVVGHSSRSFALLVYQGAITDWTRWQLFHSGTFLAWCRGRSLSANLRYVAAERSQEQFRSHMGNAGGKGSWSGKTTHNLLRILYLHTTRKNSMRQAFFATLWWAFTIHERI